MPLQRPTTTPVPDEIFDEWLAVLGHAELRVLLYLVRRTFGFDKRGGDTISYRQFTDGITTRDGRVLDRGCGVSNRTNLSKVCSSTEKPARAIAENPASLSRGGPGGPPVSV